MAAPLIAFEGIDGSGKGTQASRLVKKLEHHGRAARLLSFPRYADTFFGESIGRFLNGAFGELSQTHPALVSLLYAGDRFESKHVIDLALASAEFVICDRYVPSNLAHQAGRLSGDDRRRLIQWIEHLEYQLYHLPSPDLVVLLDLPVPLAQELIRRKSKRMYTEREADIQEADASYLARVRDTYQLLAQARPDSWVVVPCNRDDDIRSPDEIEQDIWEIIQQRYSPSSPALVD